MSQAKPSLIEPRVLKGFRDYLPQAMIPRERLIATAQAVYRSFGFSPIDNYLYIPSGDGGGANDPFHQGQDPNTLLGTVIRVDVDGAGAALHGQVAEAIEAPGVAVDAAAGRGLHGLAPRLRVRGIASLVARAGGAGGQLTIRAANTSRFTEDWS